MNKNKMALYILTGIMLIVGTVFLMIGKKEAPSKKINVIVDSKKSVISTAQTQSTEENKSTEKNKLTKESMNHVLNTLNPDEIKITEKDIEFRKMNQEVYSKYYNDKEKSKSENEVKEILLQDLLMEQYAKKIGVMITDEEMINYISYLSNYKDDQKLSDYLNALYKSRNLTNEEYWQDPLTLKFTKIALTLTKLQIEIKDYAHFLSLRKEIWEKYGASLSK